MGGGDQKQTSSQTGSSTWKPIQSQDYEQLLQRANDWLNAGGINLGTDYSGEMKTILDNQYNKYSEMMNGQVDQTALNNAMTASAESATQNFQRNVLPSIQQNFTMSGGGSGSRQGIAEGLAMGDLNSQIARTNAQLAYEAEQNNINRQMAGAQGMNNLMAGYQNLDQYQAGRANSYLQSLQAYRDMISGNFGGTESTTGTTTGTAKGGGLL